MTGRGTRGAYRKEDRISLPPELQRELVEKAAAKYGTCQELAKHLNIPKSSVHYYSVGRLTMPISVLEEMLKIAGDKDLEQRIGNRGITKDRTWANEQAISVYREMCREKLRLPTRDELEKDDDLRRKAAAIVSYVMAEGSVWLQKRKWGECAVNITFAAHETDLYNHFRQLCKDVFLYEIGPPQRPGNGAKAIRGFIYSRFVAEWLIENGVLPGDKSARELHLPKWIMHSEDRMTWISALQPWCDGEGCVVGNWSTGRPSFTLSQSRHTILDSLAVPASPECHYDKAMGTRTMAKRAVCGTNLLNYCQGQHRSEILDDLAELFGRIGFHPTTRIHGLYLKKDGFWSCIWCIALGVEDAMKLRRSDIIIGLKKRNKLP
jgi:hypothetical protein